MSKKDLRVINDGNDATLEGGLKLYCSPECPNLSKTELSSYRCIQYENILTIVAGKGSARPMICRECIDFLYHNMCL
jgi:hypothetical protein